MAIEWITEETPEGEIEALHGLPFGLRLAVRFWGQGWIWELTQGPNRAQSTVVATASVARRAGVGILLRHLNAQWAQLVFPAHDRDPVERVMTHAVRAHLQQVVAPLLREAIDFLSEEG